MNRHPFYSLLIIFTTIINGTVNPSCHAEAVLLDVIVGSVNNSPITLNEVSDKAGIEKPSTLAEASSNEAFNKALEQVIFDKILLAEAQRERIGTNDTEITRYIEQVAKQNNLTQEEFYEALREQGGDVESYKEQIQVDIIRTKFASTLIKDDVVINEEQIDQFIAQRPELTRGPGTVTLRQIVLAKETTSEDTARARLNEVKQQSLTTNIFAEYARNISDGPAAIDGGLLGNVKEKDMAPMIYRAIAAIKPGETTEIIESPGGFHLFYLEDRIASQDPKKAQNPLLREKVRQKLEKEHVSDFLKNHLAKKIEKRYVIEKKI